MSEFAGSHIVVTGASTGIGLATTRMLATRGARVFLVARNSVKLREAEDLIAGQGGKAAALAADVSDRSALLAALEAAQAAFGPIHGLFANAGTGGKATSVLVRAVRGS